jgi:hypothetical protein
MADTEIIARLRRDLPTLLREHPEVCHELWGLMLEVFLSRQEFMAFLDEMRAMREDKGFELNQRLHLAIVFHRNNCTDFSPNQGRSLLKGSVDFAI